MQIAGFVELTSDLDQDSLGRLATAAYRASKRGPVVLSLNGVDPDLVSRRLDPAVRREPHNHGVWFREGDQLPQDLIDSAHLAPFVIAQSRALTAALASRGISHMTGSEGHRFLLDLTAIPSPLDSPKPARNIMMPSRNSKSGVTAPLD